ncbi:MAG: methionine synthase [Bacteroidales bacterium]|nr:methionine synthase [Bacteroidales bacterium]
MIIKPDIYKELKNRVLVLDGAMGTMIQKYQLTEEKYRGKQFTDWEKDLKGNNDLLSLTQAHIIKEIHEKYLQAGADIIETNTFNANKISMADYKMEKFVCDLNHTSVKLAREVADKYTKLNPEKPRFVAGSMGPTNKSASMSPNVNDPSARAVTFDDLAEAYAEQARALIKGGVDMLLVETVFDTLNAKAALFAIKQIEKETGKKTPIMLSVTVADISGRTLSGQTIKAFLNSVSYIDLLSVGVNCSFGADGLRPYVEEMSNNASFYVSAYPNAGLPNQFGDYDETPEQMFKIVKSYLDDKLVNIIGGCCGTTDKHIKLFADYANEIQARKIPSVVHKTKLSGLEELTVSKENNFVNIGERANVAGSKKFARLIKEKKYEEAISIVRKQVEVGAQITDVNMDDAMLDSEFEMVNFLNLIASEPDIAKLPVMIDSSKWSVIENGLKCLQGKGIVNSISLKEGVEIFKERAEKIINYGAAIMVMAFDEKGQANTFKRRIEICERAYNILVNEVGCRPENIIFDPNVLTIGTGIEEHNNFAVDFIKTVKWIKKNLPLAKVSGGISNLSFAFRGNNIVREAMHSVFLYHTIKAGLDMGIVNAGMLQIYDDIPKDLLELVEDIVLNKRNDATERLVDFSQNIKESGKRKEKTDKWREQPVGERLQYSLIKGIVDYLDDDVNEALKIYPKALEIIEKPLMDGMNKVGKLFGEGKMFLPQIVKSARVMKKAVSILLPQIEEEKKTAGTSSHTGKILLATVKGDVHDIGKNIVEVILSCNNYEIIDIGEMVPADIIIKKAKEKNVDIIGLSGLITPSLDEMVNVAKEMQKEGMKIPLILGGATTSSVHTAVKIDPFYDGPVIQVKDASQSVSIVNSLFSDTKKKELLSEINDKYKFYRDKHSEKSAENNLISLSEARNNKSNYNWEKIVAHEPNVLGVRALKDYDIKEISQYIDWTSFFHVWDLKGKYPEILKHPKYGNEAKKIFNDAKNLLKKIIDENIISANGVFGIFPANSNNDDIEVYSDKSREKIIAVLHHLRQQTNKTDVNYCLSDFIAPKESGKNDYIGAFAVTSGINSEKVIAKFNKKNDDYNIILFKAVLDRLAEAFAELLHLKIRKEYWGFAKNEKLNLNDLINFKYQGIRAAAGYPSYPDHSEKENIFKLLNVEKNTGISLTENFAMKPVSSTCGLCFSLQDAKYFSVGKVSDEQLSDYSKRKSLDVELVKKYLSIKTE